MTSKDAITKEMTIEEIFTTFPQKAQKLAQEMTQFGLHCVGCGAATWETLEAGMLGHGMEEEKIEELLGRLNQILKEETDLTAVALTPKAAKKYLEILEEEGKQGWGLRLAEKAAGCSGFEYMLDFSQKAKNEDAVFISQEIEIHVNKHSLNRLLGSVIDYADGLQGAGFKITNPNVRSSCGCGSSHGY
jgi:iron-sulfur cluster assembly accessory protein